MNEPSQPGRTVTLVLLSPEGDALGALPPFEVETPWWQEVESVVQAARKQHGIAPAILRLLSAPADFPGGAVTYLAEIGADTAAAGRLPTQPWQATLDDHPLRMPWAKPGGPAADMAWAREVLARRGLSLAGEPEQVRTWNLSSLWRLPLEKETVWFKAVPPFFEHEGRLLERLQGRRVPRLIAHSGRRMLLHEISGDDLYEPTLEQLRRMVTHVVELQAGWIGRTEELLALGLPDWRAPALVRAVEDVVACAGGPLSSAERGVLDGFVVGLTERFAQVDECGLPDTLVHGDFHPANHRGSGEDITLLDWGDSGVGQPLLDEPAMLDRVSAGHVPVVREYWQRLWRRAVPGSDPARAAQLLAPIAAARQAVIYQKFLDNIEPSEQPYHRDDPAEWLRRTAALLQTT